MVTTPSKLTDKQLVDLADVILEDSRETLAAADDFLAALRLQVTQLQAQRDRCAKKLRGE
jgi:hypothetical protein